MTTTLLAREGVRAIVVARRAEELEKLAAEVVTEGGPEPMVIVDDLLDDGSFERVASRVLGELGGVDIIVNNLGQARPFDMDTTEEEWSEAFRLNFETPRRLTAPHPGHAGARFRPDREPHRDLGAVARERVTHREGGAADLGQGARAGCRQGRRDGELRVAGYLLTDQIRNDFIPRFVPTEREQQEWLEREIPMGRFGDPSDAANLITYLCSPLAGFITGQRIYSTAAGTGTSDVAVSRAQARPAARP